MLIKAAICHLNTVCVWHKKLQVALGTFLQSNEVKLNYPWNFTRQLNLILKLNVAAYCRDTEPWVYLVNSRILFFFNQKMYESIPGHEMMKGFKSPSFVLPGLPFSLFIRPVKWPAVRTTFQAVSSWRGWAITRAACPLIKSASMSGTPCRTCSPIAQTPPFSSLMCEYLLMLLQKFWCIVTPSYKGPTNS